MKAGLQGIHFREGSEVSRELFFILLMPLNCGKLLLKLKVKLQLQELCLVQAEEDVKRYTPLAKVGAVSQRDLEIAISRYEAQKGELDAANAALNEAKINLGYATVTAPITGLIGISAARVGDFVGRPPNAVILNTISRVDSIHVRFSISEQEYLNLVRQIEKNQGITKR